jgi:hypothetical protein
MIRRRTAVCSAVSCADRESSANEGVVLLHGQAFPVAMRACRRQFAKDQRAWERALLRPMCPPAPYTPTAAILSALAISAVPTARARAPYGLRQRDNRGRGSAARHHDLRRLRRWLWRACCENACCRRDHGPTCGCRTSCVVSGLVVEIGGLLWHGSIVAREYGPPAIMGIPDAVRRIRMGRPDQARCQPRMG